MSMTSGAGCGVSLDGKVWVREMSGGRDSNPGPLTLLPCPSSGQGGMHHVQVPFLRLGNSVNQRL
jgi:hypothetical protein